MAQKGDVELIIRAKNDATKSLDQIATSLKNLKDQQTIVGDSATRTDGQLAALGQELLKLRTNAQNLQSVSNIAKVLDTATAALDRQKTSVNDAVAAEAKLIAQQQKLAGEQAALAASLKTANTALTAQTAALATAKTSAAGLSKESTALATAEGTLNRSLTSVTNLIVTQQKALDDARAKHTALAAAVAATDTPTKRLTSSLEAADRALTKRAAALDASRTKEAELRTALTANAAAQATNKTAVDQANQALTAQKTAAQGAKDSVAALNSQSSSLTSSQKQTAAEAARSAEALARLKTDLANSRTEYDQVRAAADAARAAIGANANSSTAAGKAAAQAAIDLAVFAARMKALQAGGAGRTSTVSLGFSSADITATMAALKNAQGVVSATQREYSKASVSAAQLTTAIKSAGDASTALSTVTTAVAGQKTAIDGAKAAWKSAEDEVRRLALALKSATEPSAALATAFGTAQAQAKMAKTEFLAQETTAKNLASALQTAGVGAGTLASAEAALRSAVANANTTVTQGAAAAAALGSAEGSAEGNTSRLSAALRILMGAAAGAGGNIKTAASALVQFKSDASAAIAQATGFTSELKSMAAQAVSIYAIKEALQGVIETSTGFDALGAKIRVAFGGDIEGANKAMQFALTTAKNLKLPLLETAKGYADMAVAAKGTSLEGQGVNDIFTAFAQAARVTRTSSADLSGIFKALTQSISKGKVQAEELRGQLGDRLPGALNIMAQALGVTTPQLDKMLQAGELTTETLRNMAAEVSKRVAPELESALNSPTAKIQEFKNAWTELQLKMAQSGFLDAIGNAMQKLAAALSSPEALAGIEKLGQGLADLINYLASIEDPIGKFEFALKAIAAVMATNFVSGFVTGIINLGIAFWTLAPAVWGALAPLLPFAAAIAGIALLLASPWIAEWAYNNFPAFAEGCLTVKGVAEKAWSGIKEAWDVTGAALYNSFEQVINNIKAAWGAMLGWIATKSSGILEKVGLGSWVDDLNKAAAESQQNAENSQKGHEAEISAIHARAVADRAAIDKKTAEDVAAQLKRIAEKSAKDTAAANPVGDAARNILSGKNTDTTTGLGTVTASPYVPDTSKADAAAAKKRLAAEKSLAAEMYQIRAQLAKKSADTEQEQLDAVPLKYAALYDKLKALGKDQNSQEWKDVDALVAQEQQIIKNTNAKKATVAATKAQNDAEKNINDLLSLRRDLLEQIKYAESKGDYTTADKLKAQYDGVNQQLRTAIANQIAYWESVGGPKADLAIAKLKATADSLENVKDKAILSSQTIGQKLGGALSSFADDFLAKIAETGDVFGSLKDAFRQFASQFLLQMAQMILKQALFNALSAASSGGGIFGTIIGAAASAVGSAHTGGIAGSSGLNQRSVNPGIFSGAAKYHTGGVVGLQPWEVPIIAKKNEEVLTADDPRHINNIGAAGANSPVGGNGNQSMPNFQIVNAIDSDSVVQAGLSSPTGTKTLVNWMRANKSTVKQILG